MSYTPTPEHLARLGYLPEPAHTVMPFGLRGYSQRVPAPVLPWQATLVVQLMPKSSTVYLDRHAGRGVEHLWKYPVPTPLFFEQLLQALGWPSAPAVDPELRADACMLQDLLDDQQQLLNYVQMMRYNLNPEPEERLQRLFKRGLFTFLDAGPDGRGGILITEAGRQLIAAAAPFVL